MAKERQVVAVFGLGSFGREVCRSLAEGGASVIAVDNDPQLIDRIKDEVRQAVLLDSTDEESIQSAALTDVDTAVVAMGENIEASVLTTALLKQLGITRIISRAINDVHQRVLRALGADEIVNLEIEEGRRVASRILAQEVLDMIPISADFSIAELHVPESMRGQTMSEVRESAEVNVMAVKRIRTSVDGLGNPVKTETVFLPRDGDTLEDGDVFVLVGPTPAIEGLRGAGR